MNIMRYLIVTAIALAAIFVGFLYWTLKTKTKVVTNEIPFSEVMNKKLALQRGAVIVKNRPAYVYENPYLIVEEGDALDEEITEIHSLPVGTSLMITAAKLLKNGTSGFTTSVVFGTVTTDFGEIPFEYHWGDEHSTLSNEIPNYFTFPKPVWASENDYENQQFVFK